MISIQPRSKSFFYSLLFCTIMVIFSISSCKNADSSSTDSTSETNIKTEKETKVNQKVSIDQVIDLVDNEKYQLIDLRTPEEVIEGGTIEFSKIMNFRANDFEQQVDLMDKNGKYILYCKSGGRSGKALKMFNEKGFQNVREMAAGYDKWKAKFN